MRNLKTLSVCFVSSILFAACQAPLPKNDFYWTSPSVEKLKTVAPIDIAVLMPRDNTTRTSLFPGVRPPALPLAEIREIAYRELIRQRYTPISLTFLDNAFFGKATPSEASFKEVEERTNADALLSISIKRWDDSRWRGDKVLGIGAELYLIDAKTGETLWQANIDWDMNFAMESDIHRATTTELTDRAVSRFFQRLVQAIPMRGV